MAALFSKKEKDSKIPAKPEKSKVQKEPEFKHEHDETGSPIESAGGLAIPQGGDSEAYRFVLNPHVTEKATNGNILNKYTFKVAKNSNKIEIKKAIEKLYKVKVSSVNIQNIPSKKRQIGRYMGTKSGFKKAIITLKEGQKIEVV